MGDWLLFIAVPVYVYALTGSALLTGLEFVASLVPMLLLGPIAGVFVDRWDRRRTMIGADLFRACLMLALLLVTSRSNIWIVYVVTLSRATAGQLFLPASQAMLPKLVPGDALVGANSLMGVALSVASLAGPALGGGLYFVLGFRFLVFLDVASFVISALSIAVMRYREPAREAEVAASGGVVRRFLAELREGLAIIFSSPLLRAAAIVAAAGNIVTGVLSSLVVPFVVHVLHGRSTDVGFVAAAQGAGGLLGAVLAPRLAAAISAGRLVLAAQVSAAVLVTAFASSRTVPLAVAFLVLAAIPAVMVGISLTTLIQMGTPPAALGRVLAAVGTFAASASAAGALTGGALADTVGAGTVFIAAAALLALAAIPASAGLLRSSPQPSPASG
jgi:predicted MFS family arabinose efflux permease